MHGNDAYPWLEKGDIVTLEVEHLGQISSRLIDPAPLVPLRS